MEAFVGLRKRLEVETDRGRKIASGRRVRLEAVTPVVVEVESTWAREVSCVDWRGVSRCLREHRDRIELIQLCVFRSCGSAAFIRVCCFTLIRLFTVADTTV